MTRHAAALLLWPLAVCVALAQAPEPERGAKLDVSDFEYRRPLEDGGRGLVALTLDAAVLAHSRGPDRRFADVRIVDGDGFQIPYVLEQRSEPLSIDLPLQTASLATRELADTEQRNRSVYAVVLPHQGLPEPRLELETSNRVFRRRVRIGIERPADRDHREPWVDWLGTSTWQHVDPDTPAPALELAVAPRESTRLLLVVDEGDNRPLVIRAVRLRLPSWQLRFFKPSGDVQVVYGNESVRAPQYDLALLGTFVSGAEAREIEAGPETAQPHAVREVLPSWLFWSGLSAAAVILLAVIVRLILSGTPAPPSPPQP